MPLSQLYIVGTPNSDYDVIYVGCWSNKSDTFETFMEDKTVAAVEDVQLDILTSVVTDSFFLSQPQVVIRGTAALALTFTAEFPSPAFCPFCLNKLRLYSFKSFRGPDL